MIFVWLTHNPKKKEKEKKKLFSVNPRWTTIHASSRKEEDTETNKMMNWKRRYNHRCQLHVPLEVDEVANTWFAHVCFYLYKTKNDTKTNQ
jgi:transposase